MGIEYWPDESDMKVRAADVARLLREDDIPRTGGDDAEVIAEALDDLELTGSYIEGEFLDFSEGFEPNDGARATAWDEFLAVIAPVVPDGQYIEFSHDGDTVNKSDRFRVYFKDGKAHEVYPTLVWDTSDVL